jgi:serine phosphatase RsbU (regulator of sigma subunit)
VIYTFTDGYADQFGGPKGKKFKYTQLKEMLLSIQHLSLQEQEEYCKTTIYKLERSFRTS